MERRDFLKSLGIGMVVGAFPALVVTNENGIKRNISRHSTVANLSREGISQERIEGTKNMLVACLSSYVEQNNCKSLKFGNDEIIKEFECEIINRNNVHIRLLKNYDIRCDKIFIKGDIKVI